MCCGGEEGTNEPQDQAAVYICIFSPGLRHLLHTHACAYNTQTLAVSPDIYSRHWDVSGLQRRDESNESATRRSEREESRHEGRENGVR